MAQNEIQVAEYRTKLEELAGELDNDNLLDDARAAIETQIQELQSRIKALERSTEPEKRSSSRERRPTEKALQNRAVEIDKRKHKLTKHYENWRKHASEIRKRLLTPVSLGVLQQLQSDLKEFHAAVLNDYDALKGLGTPESEVVERVDNCMSVTATLLSLIMDRQLIDPKDFSTSRERERTREVKHAHPSIFGDSVSEMASIASDHTKDMPAGEPKRGSDNASVRSHQSGRSSIISQRAKAEAELAEKRAKAEALATEEAQQARLLELQNQVRAEEMRLKRIQADAEIKAAEAKAKVLAEAYEDEVGVPSSPSKLNPKAPQFKPSKPYSSQAEKSLPVSTPLSGAGHSIEETASQAQSDIGALAKLLSGAMTTHRLPPPEPGTFKGDPLMFIQWSRSFKMLVEAHCLSSADKLFYLQKYIDGEAKTVLDGTFYRQDDSAYEQAWDKLNSRYGHPFVLLKAFREKLNGWPKINAKDAIKLREFGDFLTACSEAIPHVPGLEVLNDYDQNQKLLTKLPEMIAGRWNRRVTAKLDDEQPYPNFKEFAGFVSQEARIACNPITSMYALKAQEEKVQPALESKKGGARTLSTKTSSEPKAQKDDELMQTDNETSKPLICPFCDTEGHTLPTCKAFQKKPIEERRNFVKSQNRCYGCLRTGHGSKTCRRKHTCGVCKGRHPTCLHENDFVPRSAGNENTKAEQPKAESTKAAPSESKKEATAATLNSSSGSVSLTSHVVPVWVSAVGLPQNERLVYALLDTQSDSTFVDGAICDSLQCKVQPVKLRMTTMLGKGTEIDSQRATGLQVRALTSEEWVPLPPAYTRENIPLDRSHIPTCEIAKRWEHLRCITKEVPPLLDCDVGLLIGYNCPQALVPRKVITGENNEPYAVKTDLGWSIVGNTTQSHLSACSDGFCYRITVKEPPPMTPRDAIKALEQDFQDTKVDETSISQDDILFLNKMDSGISKNDKGHYEMPLPFKTRPNLPDNRKTALVRLKCLKRKLQKDHQYRDHYQQFMKSLFEAGHAEIVTEEPTPGGTWYIPHHGVYHPAKPNKLRVVFDCSARHGGTSLNDHLLTGPDLTNSLVGVLLRFRCHPIAVTCDIEKMFYQFYVDHPDRDFLRFFWWREDDLDGDPIECHMTVHLFGAASSPGCANYGLKYLVKEHGERYPFAADFIKRNFYVDDGITSVPTEEDAKLLVTESKELCAKGNLRLHKFLSNSKNVMETIDPQRCGTDTAELDFDRSPSTSERALGLRWSIHKDLFTFKLSVEGNPQTRRTVLSTVASLYDPLGLLAPFTLLGKRVLQATCQQGTKWDEPLPEKLKPEWEAWMSDLQRLDLLSIPRCYLPDGFGHPVTTQLHHFSDASTRGYGTCSYLRAENSNGQVHCSLIIGKSRVAPSKIVTIPRLELSAAVVSAKMSRRLRQELDMKIDQEFFWVDSKVALGYISNESKRFHVFVANRVEVIRQLTNPNMWHYVPTGENPADLASRGTSVTELLQSDWFRGPEFLWQKDLNVTPDHAHQLVPGDPEVRVTECFKTTTAAEPIDWEQKIERFSSWRKLTGAIARLSRRARGNKSKGISTVQERENATALLIKAVQQHAFSAEVAILQSKTKTLPRDNRISQLEPTLEDGILKAGGRLRKAPLSSGEINPIILPKESNATRLIISHYHGRVNHQGRGMTLNELRGNGYCVLGGSKTVANYIHRCVTCRKGRRPPEEQKMADLPKERMEATPPFWYSGMDCFGPYIVKRGRRSFKAYGLLFTCFYSRAIHIEMLEDMTTDSFINGLRCFIAIRGPVRELRSDQGTNFVGASNELKVAMQEMEPQKIEAFLGERQCDLRFNPPSSSHAGGLWERQIRTVKGVLGSTVELSQGRLDPASLRTLFYEAMTIVNNRPLAIHKVNDTDQPLTPNHLLSMKSAVALPPPGEFVKEDVYLNKRWRRVQYLTEQFWSRWKGEYLYNISNRQKWTASKRNVSVGDVVLLKESASRNEWPLGRVIEAIPDDDGLVRKVKLHIATKRLDKQGRRTDKVSTLHRPIQKIVVLLEAPT